MEIRKTTSTVKPAVKTPQRSIPLTPLDMLFPFPFYPSFLFIYRSPAEGSKIDGSALKESLSKTLVHFYPLAGRCRLTGNGRAMEIDCNDAGILYVEAQTDSDLGDFTPSSEMSVLVPAIIDNTQDISSYSLFAVQVTYFNCGGVSIGICIEHHCMDGSSACHFMCSWSEIARGLDISVPPFLDRSLIRPRDPPQPNFDHPEFLLLQPTTNISQINSEQLKVSAFKLTKNQLYEMKAKVGEYNTFEVVAGHIWKCVCKARGLGSDQETILVMPVDARYNRWKPELPPNFFGNAALLAMVAVKAGDLESKQSSYAAAQIHKTLVRIDSEFFRSVVDCLGQLADSISPPAKPLICEFDPNFLINSLTKLGIKNVDFGWGPPIYLGPAVFDYETAWIIPHDHDGSVYVVIALRPQHMKTFHKLLYTSEREVNSKL